MVENATCQVVATRIPGTRLVVEIATAVARDAGGVCLMHDQAGRRVVFACRRITDTGVCCSLTRAPSLTFW